MSYLQQEENSLTGVDESQDWQRRCVVFACRGDLLMSLAN
jgi:hypothetical protein